MSKTLILIASALFLSASSLLAEPVQSERSFKAEITRTVGYDYLLYLPGNYESDKAKTWPLLLFLHGAGERGGDLELVKIHGPPMLIEAGKEFPFIVLSPQCPKDQWWDHEALMALLDEIEKGHRVDPKRIYVTGLSMGGFGTWDLAGRYPEKFAAAAPICGGGSWLLARNMTKLPIWAFHGAKDAGVPLAESERMVETLKENGSTLAKLTVYPEAGHNAWTETYDNPEFYQWLLSHSRE